MGFKLQKLGQTLRPRGQDHRSAAQIFVDRWWYWPVLTQAQSIPKPSKRSTWPENCPKWPSLALAPWQRQVVLAAILQCTLGMWPTGSGMGSGKRRWCQGTKGRSGYKWSINSWEVLKIASSHEIWDISVSNRGSDQKWQFFFNIRRFIPVAYNFARYPKISQVG